MMSLYLNKNKEREKQETSRLTKQTLNLVSFMPKPSKVTEKEKQEVSGIQAEVKDLTATLRTNALQAITVALPDMVTSLHKLLNVWAFKCGTFWLN